MVTPAAHREAAAYLQSTYEMSQRRACRVIGSDRTSVRYQARRPNDGALRERLNALAQERRRFGYRRLHVLLRREGHEVNKKQVQRIYREERLTVRRRGGRKRAIGTRRPIETPVAANQRWSLDFVSGQMTDGRRFRILTVNCTWQRCRVHFMRNVMAHAGKSGRAMVSAFIGTAFAQDDAQGAKAQWRGVSDQLRPKLPKLAGFLDEAETDVLAYMTFPAPHRTKLHSTNSLERLNGEIKRRTEVVGIFPNEAAIIRPVGAILLEQNDEWAVQRCRYMTLESVGALSDDPIVSLPIMAT
jgi:hypothetical protein